MDTNTIKVPEGFELEQRNQPMNLPEGFELETEPDRNVLFEQEPTYEIPDIRENIKIANEYDVPVDVVNTGLFHAMANSFTDPLDYDPDYQPSKPYQILSKEATRKYIVNPPTRLIWKGLQIIGWPFERIENLISGPLKPLTKESARRASQTVRYIMYKANGLEPPQEAKEAVEIQHFLKYIRERAIPAYKEAGKAIVPTVKALNPWSDVPQKDLDTFTDVYRGYWEGISNDNPPPEWFAQSVGVGTSFIITPYLVGKVFRFIGKVGKSSPFYKAIQEYRIPEYQKMKRLARLETRARIFDAEKLGKSISKKDLAEVTKRMSEKLGKPVSKSAVQQRLIQIIKGGITEQPALSQKATPIIKEFRKNAEILKRYRVLSEYTYTTKMTKAQIAKIHKNITDSEKQLKRLRTAPHYIGTKEISKEFPGRAEKIRKLEENISANLDKIHINDLYGGTNYFPRMYLTKEAQKASKRFPFWGKSRIRAPYAKQREAYLQLHPEARKEMGEILTDYPVIKSLIRENIDIELAKHYRQIAQTPRWTSRVAAGGFKMLPEDKAYGELAGKFVKNIIYNDIKDIHRIKGNIEVIYDTAIGSWKAAVTVWSPSVHFRNMFSNSILLDLSGVDHIEQARLLKQMIKEVRNNSDDYQQAKRYLTRGTFSEAELMDDLLAGTKVSKGTGIQKSIDFVAKSSRKMSSKPSDIYGKEEFISKFTKFLSERNKGKNVMESVQQANKWLFDYGELAAWEKNYARRIMPFYTFPRKAIPRVMESVATKPHTIAKYAIFHWAMEKYSLHKLNLTEEDYAQIKKIMPDYMKNNSYMLMPYRDKNGDMRFFDITYMLPWGQISDFQERGVTNVLVSNPLLQVVGDIQRNKDAFSGRDIWEETDTEKEKFIKQVLHFWQSAAPLPPWFPGGRYYDKIYESVTGKPSKKWDILLDKEPSLPETLLHTLGGLRTQPFDVGKQAMFYWQDKQDKFVELEKKMSDAFIQQSAGNLTPEELQEKWEQYIGQIVDLVAE